METRSCENVADSSGLPEFSDLLIHRSPYKARSRAEFDLLSSGSREAGTFQFWVGLRCVQAAVAAAQAGLAGLLDAGARRGDTPQSGRLQSFGRTTCLAMPRDIRSRLRSPTIFFSRTLVTTCPRPSSTKCKASPVCPASRQTSPIGTPSRRRQPVGDRPPGAGHCWPRFGRLRPRAEAGDLCDGVTGPEWSGSRQTGVAGV